MRLRSIAWCVQYSRQTLRVTSTLNGLPSAYMRISFIEYVSLLFLSADPADITVTE